MTKIQHLILLPVFGQVLLTYVLLFAMGRARVGAIAAQKVRIKDIAVSQEAWPQPIRRIANAFHNQLEMPVLFYAVVAFTLILGLDGRLMTALAWGFFALRLSHALIHTLGGHIRYRFAAFVAGTLVLLAMWCLLALQTSGLV